MALALVLIGLQAALLPLQAQSTGSGFVFGRVFDDRNSNDVLDAGEPCVPSVVTLQPDGTGVSQSSVVDCEEVTQYFFGQVPPGSYTLSVTSTTPAEFLAPTFSISFPAGRITQLQRDIPLRRRSSIINGRVALDVNGNRQLDAGEPPLAGIRIDLFDAATGDLIRTTSTGGGGAFDFAVQSPGEFLLVQHDLPQNISTAVFPDIAGRAVIVDLNRLRVSLSAGQSATGLLFLDRSTANASIAGRALADSNDDGTLGPEDAPLARLDIHLLDTTGNRVAATRTLDDGSYFFDTPPGAAGGGSGYLVTTAPPFGVTPRRVFPGPGAVPAGSNAILIPRLTSGTVQRENNFLLHSRGLDGPPLPAGPAAIEGFVAAQVPGARRNQPLAGVTLLLRDADGMTRAGTSTNPNGLFRFEKLPIGTYSITEIDPRGHISVDAIPGQNGTRVDAHTLSVRMVPVLSTYAGYQFIDRQGEAPGSVNTIQGVVTGERDGSPQPLPDVVLVLEEEAGSVHSVARTDASGRYSFQRLPRGIYRVVAADPADTSGGDAIPGPHASKVDERTLQVAMVEGVTQYPANNFVKRLGLTLTGSIERLVAVGDPVAAVGRLGIFGTDPIDQDQNVSAIRRVGTDGSAYVADFGGSSLLRLGTGPPQIQLDTSRRDPIDGIGLARFLRVETSLNGVSGILALRADNTRGIYRWENGVLTRLALLTDPEDLEELVIGDTGQIAYVARTTEGAPAVFQNVGTQITQVLGPGQVVRDALGRVVDGARVERFRELSSNGAGDLAFHVSLPRFEGKRPQAVIRKTSQGLGIVAMTGQLVVPDRGPSGPVELTGLGRPIIGPDGTIACRGTMDNRVNFFVDGPRRRFEPSLRGANWNREETTFDYDVAASGAVALRAAPGSSTESGLYLVLPTGGVLEVQAPGGRIQPAGRPVFVPQGNEGLFFFLAKALDRPRDRHGRVPVVLCRSRLINGRPVVDAAALPGNPVPQKPSDVQLLSILQRPVVTQQGVVFGAMFGGGENFPVPTAGLFRIPLDGTLADATLLAEEGTELAGADRVGLLQALSYTSDGSLFFGGLLPGAGSLLASVSPTAGTAGVVRTQAVRATVAPMLAVGQPLDRPDRRLQAILGRLIALGSDRQLFVARFAEGGAAGEGLFNIARDGSVQAIAVTGDPAPGVPAARFAGFADTEAFTLSDPSVSTDGRVVFKTRLDRAGTSTFGVFHWTGAALNLVGLREPDPDNMALTEQDRPPYSLERWAAGPGGRAYLMERHQTSAALQVTRLFEHSPEGLSALVIPGVTPILGGAAGPLADLFDYVVSGEGRIFVHGAASGIPGVLAAGSTGLTPVVRQGQPVPPPLDGTNVQGFVFGGSFALMPDSARGTLLFRAGVAKPGDPPRTGLFRLSPQGLETLMVESVAVGGARDVTFGTLAASPDRQTAGGVTVFATFDSKARRWSIFRWRAGTTTLVAQEGQPLSGGAKIVSMDAGPVLDLPPGSGPVFTVNDAGDVAFLASDGQRWGIYLFRGQ